MSYKGHADLVIPLGARSDEIVEVDVWGDVFAAALVSADAFVSAGALFGSALTLPSVINGSQRCSSMMCASSPPCQTTHAPYSPSTTRRPSPELPRRLLLLTVFRSWFGGGGVDVVVTGNCVMLRDRRGICVLSC